MQQVPRHIATRIRPLMALLLLGLLTVGAMAQQGQGGEGRVEVLNADRWEYDKDLATGAQRLIGHVRFKHEQAFMTCDSAHLYSDERVTAFGHVVLTQGDTLRITGNRLEYDGRQRTARMTGQVKLSDPGMELTSDALLYDLAADRAEYTNGARIVGKRDGNTLISRKGRYEARGRVFHFTDSVRLTHPERTIEADTLTYHTATGMAEFRGPTWIFQPDATLYAERGSYDTRTGKGRFTRRGRIESNGQLLQGDTLHYDRETGLGEAWGHVSITDTVNRIVVRGREGRHHQATGEAMVTGRAELVMVMGEDSLYLHADTLFATQDSIERRQVTARRQVRFFKNDLQGICDTLVYAQADSLITLQGGPFLWSGEDQISGDTVRIKLRDGHAETLHVDGAAFMISEVDSAHYNQVTGLAMTGRFRNNELYSLVAEGNSRTIYFVKEAKDSVEQVTGMNRADCSIITVGLDSGQVSTVSFITQPTATLHPLEQVAPGQMRLEGFRWNAALRPRDREDIFRKEEGPGE